METKKYQRSSKFSDEELDILGTFLQDNPALISGEFGKLKIKEVAHRNEVWEPLSRIISASNLGIKRTAEQLKKKMDFLKI